MLGQIGRVILQLLVGTTDTGAGMSLRGRAALYAFLLFALLFVVGLILVMAGYDLNLVDRWLDRRASLFDNIGSLAFRVLGGIIALLCLLAFVGGLWQRVLGGDKPAKGQDDQRLGWGCILVAPLVGYFAWFMMTG